VAAENNEAAIFGEVSYRAGAHWTTRMGIRQADLRQEQRAGRIVGALPPLDGGEANFEMVEHNTNYHPVSGRAVLEYAFDSDALVYGSVANGFRRGGINIPSPFEHLEIPTFYAPDESMNYEIGWKLAFPGLNATVNGAVYRIDWNHVQTLFLTDTYPGANYYGNGSNAFINGFELEGTLEPIRALALRGSFALADARLADDQVLLKDPLILHGQRGDRLPFVPRVSGSLSLSYRHSLGASAFHGFAILNAQCQGKRTTDYSGGLRGYPGPTGRNYAVMKSYCASQAQLGIGADRFRGAVYVDNLLDQRAQIMLFPSDTGVGQITIRPRTLGLFLRYSFD
jgi:outer membrane receptor protein involved in Fe transport